MKKIIFLNLVLLLLSCNNKCCDYFSANKEIFEETLDVIKKNDFEFSNSMRLPRVYYTYNYQKKESEFKKTISAGNMKIDDYIILKKNFNQLSISKILIYDEKNFLFKVEESDYFVSTYDNYIAYLDYKTIDMIKNDFDVRELNNCEEHWYCITIRNSIAK